MTEDVRIIKRYQNRKLYDTYQSCYVTLDEISQVIREGNEIKVANIFEEYANGGLQIINSWIEESEEELLENIEQNMTKLGLLSAKA